MNYGIFRVETSTRTSKRTGKVSTWQTERLIGTRYTLKSKITRSNIKKVLQKIEVQNANLASDIKQALTRIAKTGQVNYSDLTLNKLLSYGTRNAILRMIYNFGWTPEEVCLEISVLSGAVIDVDYLLDINHWFGSDLVLPNGQIASFDWEYGDRTNINII